MHGYCQCYCYGIVIYHIYHMKWFIQWFSESTAGVGPVPPVGGAPAPSATSPGGGAPPQGPRTSGWREERWKERPANREEENTQCYCTCSTDVNVYNVICTFVWSQRQMSTVTHSFYFISLYVIRSGTQKTVFIFIIAYTVYRIRKNNTKTDHILVYAITSLHFPWSSDTNSLKWCNYPLSTIDVPLIFKGWGMFAIILFSVLKIIGRSQA